MTLKISVPTCDPRGAFYLTTLQAKLRVTTLCIERMMSRCFIRGRDCKRSDCIGISLI